MEGIIPNNNIGLNMGRRILEEDNIQETSKPR